jgi:uncharacterized protein (TIGR03086 family)
MQQPMPGADTADLHRRASHWFSRQVDQIRPDQWHLPTPCSDWDVRELVNHVAGEALWTPPLMAGGTIAEVGDRFDGDVLGDAPVDRWHEAAAEAQNAIDASGALDKNVHLSFGDTPATEYVTQLFADHLIHGWDLAQAIGADTRMDPELVTACATWFDTVEPLYRQAGAIGPALDVSPDADAQAVLLSRFGRTAALGAP